MSTSLLVFVVLTASPAVDAGEAKSSKADRLVELALEAELLGDNARRRDLLEQALRLSPQCEAARWHAGQMRVGRQWLTVTESQQAAAEDPLLARYRQTLAECYERMIPAAAHLSMARWCRQSKLAQQQRFHWLTLLELSPNEPEALAALGLCWYEGELVSRDEVTVRQTRQRAEREWSERLQRLARALLGSDDSEQADVAWQRLRDISDPAAAAGLETVIAPCSERLGLDVVALLGKIRGDSAAASLIRLTESPCDAVREAALAQLKRRPLHQSVPQVLAGMRWPVELEQEVSVSPRGDVEYASTVTAENPQAKTIVKTTASTAFSDVPALKVSYSGSGPRINRSVQVYGPTPSAKYANRLRTVQSYQQRARTARQTADAYNREVYEGNEAASRLLYDLAGEDLGPDPQRWLDWWMNYNEYESPGEKPVYTHNYDDSRFVRDGPFIRVTYIYASCFARGTPIWTQTGTIPVEQIQPGDLVLAQDPQTGELAYKPVLQTTLRLPSPLRRIHVEGEEIDATRGHPFWVSGGGWRMAKELQDGQPLHGLGGSRPIRQIEEQPAAEAYNLVVDDFHTYFVGRIGLLVHDNHFRQPTTAVLPGLHRVREP
ncbi:MAG: hypothetical protein GXY83_08510 [Rhodopirellula sp.]|nr:hypothetical protein [Rhodopirellula sp.]